MAVDVKSAANPEVGERHDRAVRWRRSAARNGGGPPAGPSLSFDDAAWQDAANLLLFSTLRMIRAVVPSMTSRGGGAILVSTSSSVKEPIPNLGLSTVLRASVSALAKTLALELAPSKIRVNQIVPGASTRTASASWTRSTARSRGYRRPTRKPSRSAAIPMGRYGEADEFGRVGAFLLSDAASYMTGATVQVDGGTDQECALRGSAGRDPGVGSSGRQSRSQCSRQSELES